MIGLHEFFLYCIDYICWQVGQIAFRTEAILTGTDMMQYSNEVMLIALICYLIYAGGLLYLLYSAMSFFWNLIVNRR